MDDRDSSTPTVSVVTAAKGPRLPYLLDSWESLLHQAGIAWEWLIQTDGPAPDLPAELLNDHRVDVAHNGRQLGIAVTRNRALARARGPYVKALDADDLLTPDALKVSAEVLAENPRAAFVFGRSSRLTATGEERADEAPDFAVGTVTTGELERRWRRDGRSSLRYGTIAWRREVLLAYGGWAALSEMEDVSVTLAVNLHYCAAFTDRVLLLSRDHADQASISAACISDRPLNRQLVHSRLVALHRSEGLPVPEGYASAPPDASTPKARDKARSFRPGA